MTWFENAKLFLHLFDPSFPQTEGGTLMVYRTESQQDKHVLNYIYKARKVT